MAILYDWYENPGESDDSEEKGFVPMPVCGANWQVLRSAGASMRAIRKFCQQ